MTLSSTLFLRVVIVLIGILALAAMIWFPLTEGRAANLDLLSIYFDFFILYGYAASIPFFVALYQAFKLLGYIGQNKAFSLSSVKSLRTIKYCAIAVAGFIVVGEVLLMITHDGKDDMAGAVSMGIMTTLVSIVIATVAAVFERTLQSAVDIKSENELIV
ncbi:MAG: DUF2975 domain-containing protein [Ignavibacteriae bacterium]|nr:DUF2975 domain-containing protein [Ignavibacteriota bacterium]